MVLVVLSLLAVVAVRAVATLRCLLRVRALLCSARFSGWTVSFPVELIIHCVLC